MRGSAMAGGAVPSLHEGGGDTYPGHEEEHVISANLLSL